jgi:hypothetical protein
MNWQSPLPDGVMFYRDLFKYRTLRTPTGEVNTYTQDIFTSRALWCDKPSAFNDPFDRNLPLYSSQVPPHVMEEARATILAEQPNVPEWALQAALNHASKQTEVLQGSIEKERNITYNESSVFCWATRGDNIAMFSYYADSHKGICLQFKLEHRHPLAMAMQVEYEEKFPALDYSQITNTDQLVKSLILTKAKCWGHEGESRVFRRAIPPGKATFPSESLVRVIFGCRSTDEDITLVKSWLSGWPSRVILARATPDEQSFTLKINDVDNIPVT